MRRGTRAALLCAAVVALAAPVGAQRALVDVSRLGSQVGEQVPDFRLPDQTGRVWTRESIMGPNGAMLVFFRSADW